MKLVDKIIPAKVRKKAGEGFGALLSSLKQRVKKRREAACAYSSPLRERFAGELKNQPEVPAVFAIDDVKKAKASKSRKYTLSDFWEIINSNNTLLILLVVIGLLCSIAFGAYVFEVGVNEAFKSPWDTLWWTIVTLTTVGYGDKVPVTIGGRILGIFMMVLGVASVGIVTGRIASFLVDKQIKARGGLIVLDRKKGHFVICGWKAELEAILEKILTVDPNLKPTDLVLVNDAEPQEIDHIRSIPTFKTIKYIKGDYIDEKVLGRANVKSAGTVLILADSSKNFSLQEVDSRTVMAAITVDSFNKDVYTCAELIDEKFVKYLKLANCDEIILYSGILQRAPCECCKCIGSVSYCSGTPESTEAGIGDRRFPTGIYWKTLQGPSGLF
jgi:voltage-gated potassium channel Kch